MNAFTVDQAASVNWSLPELWRSRHVGFQAAGGDLPAWVFPFVDRVQVAISTVDPRGSSPPNADDLRDAVYFLARVMQDDTMQPWVGLLASGGLQMNWRKGDVEVEAVFDRGRDDQMVYVTVGDNEWEEPV